MYALKKLTNRLNELLFSVISFLTITSKKDDPSVKLSRKMILMIHV